MSEFAGVMEDWDLQAIVRGCTSEFATTIMEDMMSSQSCSFVPFDVQQDDDFLYGFSDCFDNTTSVFDELDELYKPFYPQSINQLLPSSSSSSSSSMYVPNEVNEPQLDLPKQQPLTGLSTVDAANNICTPMPKRRKNQHNKVVKQVTADDLSSDSWAWRKYGQKPIKGSPYPRSYYRCSSLKGCLARKQVERSSLDPAMFIITYTAEHSHSHPVRRNSLAGKPKKKSSPMKNPSTGTDSESAPVLKESSCCSPISSTTVLSPTFPLLACLEDEFPQHENKRERMDNALLSGYEELDGINSDMSAFECWFSDQIPTTFES